MARKKPKGRRRGAPGLWSRLQGTGRAVSKKVVTAIRKAGEMGGNVAAATPGAVRGALKAATDSGRKVGTFLAESIGGIAGALRKRPPKKKARKPAARGKRRR